MALQAPSPDLARKPPLHCASTSLASRGTFWLCFTRSLGTNSVRSLSISWRHRTCGFAMEDLPPACPAPPAAGARPARAAEPAGSAVDGPSTASWRWLSTRSRMLSMLSTRRLKLASSSTEVLSWPEGSAKRRVRCTAPRDRWPSSLEAARNSREPLRMACSSPSGSFLDARTRSISCGNSWAMKHCDSRPRCFHRASSTPVQFCMAPEPPDLPPVPPAMRAEPSELPRNVVSGVWNCHRPKDVPSTPLVPHAI
mmetsp:Transcript_26839/g.85262  ORF Transcript_26839/g.85262 Transcript_26839/m.85262 type:complete len:254 (-) Transcript_26839:130-891(-)